MTIEEAYAAYKAAFPDSSEWIEFFGGEVTLDGSFTLPQLRLIAELLGKIEGNV